MLMLILTTGSLFFFPGRVIWNLLKAPADEHLYFEQSNQSTRSENCNDETMPKPFGWYCLFQLFERQSCLHEWSIFRFKLGRMSNKPVPSAQYQTKPNQPHFPPPLSPFSTFRLVLWEEVISVIITIFIAIIIMAASPSSSADLNFVGTLQLTGALELLNDLKVDVDGIHVTLVCLVCLVVFVWIVHGLCMALF